MTVYNINNLEIVANHQVNATTNVKNADTESMDIDNINGAETEIDNNDDVAKSNNNDDNPIMSDKESPLESPTKDNTENNEVGENSTEEVPSLLIYGRKHMTQQKLSPQKGADLSRSHPWNPQWVIHKKTKIKMQQIHQIPTYLILMMYEYMHSSWKENQKVKN